MSDSDSTLRQLMGIETESGFKRIEIGYQRILDNLHLVSYISEFSISEFSIGTSSSSISSSYK